MQERIDQLEAVLMAARWRLRLVEEWIQHEEGIKRLERRGADTSGGVQHIPGADCERSSAPGE